MFWYDFMLTMHKLRGYMHLECLNKVLNSKQFDKRILNLRFAYSYKQLVLQTKEVHRTPSILGKV